MAFRTLTSVSSSQGPSSLTHLKELTLGSPPPQKLLTVPGMGPGGDLGPDGCP